MTTLMKGRTDAVYTLTACMLEHYMSQLASLKCICTYLGLVASLSQLGEYQEVLRGMASIGKHACLHICDAGQALLGDCPVLEGSDIQRKYQRAV